jgi:hypothetical protein
VDIVLRIGFLRYPAAARATNQHPENGGFQSMAVPPSHPKLDHCNIETLGDLGISHFAEPPNRFCLVLNIYIYITQPDPYHKPINIDIGDDYQCYIYIYAYARSDLYITYNSYNLQGHDICKANHK